MRYSYVEKLSEIIQNRIQNILKQVWILRKSAKPMNFDLFTAEKVQEKMSMLFQDLMMNPYDINHAITLGQFKFEISSRYIPVPLWMNKPQYRKINQYDLPFKITKEVFKEKMGQITLIKQMQEFYKNIYEEEKKQQNQNQNRNQTPNSGRINQNWQFTPQHLTLECAKNFRVAYIWYGQKKMPKEYKYLLYKCRNNVVLLRQTEFQTYSAQWNRVAPPQYQIIAEKIPVRQRINMLKLLYLYFESGIYADFDTQINEECFKDVYTNEMIFTNRMEDNNRLPFYFLPVYQIAAPEESFMMVRNKFNPQVKRMIEQKILQNIGQGDRWKECKYRQCLIVECQRHDRDNTYKKGYV